MSIGERSGQVRGRVNYSGLVVRVSYPMIGHKGERARFLRRRLIIKSATYVEQGHAKDRRVAAMSQLNSGHLGLRAHITNPNP